MSSLSVSGSALVTGASGFIGRRLCARLAEAGVRVNALMRHDAKGPWQAAFPIDIAGDGIPPAALAAVDTVFHLAGRVHLLSERRESLADYDAVNVRGTQALLRAAERAGASRFVFFSSVKAMGEGGDTCLDERSDAEPASAYGRSKRRAETLVREAGRSSALQITILRLPLVYGAGARGNLRSMFRAVAGHRFPPLPEMSNRRSLVHVEDVVRAAMCVANEPRANGETYIVTDGQTYSTCDIYRAMCTSLGHREPPWTMPIPVLRGVALAGDSVSAITGRRWGFDSTALRKLLGSAWYSSAKLERELGFVPTHSLEDGLREMLDCGDLSLVGESAA